MSKYDHPMAGVIRRAFADSGMSLKRLSVRSGTAYASVHAFFADEALNPALSSVGRWCDALGLELRPAKRKRGK